MTANERRMEILNELLEQRATTLSRLQMKFDISRSTARRDIQELSCSYPIITTQGGGGGIRMADGYRLGMRYMTDAQTALLEKLSETLTGEELLTMRSILRTFTSPMGAKVG